MGTLAWVPRWFFSSPQEKEMSMSQQPKGAIPLTGDRGVIESKFLAHNRVILGVDEVGRGCLAGPLFAGACVLDYQRLWDLSSDDLKNLRDSKRLTPLKRQNMLSVIEKVAIEYFVGKVSEREIEELGIVQANSLAILRAAHQCKSKYDLVLVDGKQRVKGFEVDQHPVVKGDDLCYVIAAAAIVAKEARDQYMRHQATTYPHYGFETHVGYGTALHLRMIDQYGICPLHRKNFEPIRTLVAGAPQTL